MSESKSKKNGSNQTLVCSFCGKTEKQVKKMVKVGKHNKPICDQCIGICTQILDDTK